MTQFIVTSPIGGDYICPLFGHCIAPKPQGPIILKPGSTSAVMFKNVFSTSATFNCVVVSKISLSYIYLGQSCIQCQSLRDHSL